MSTRTRTAHRLGLRTRIIAALASLTALFAVMIGASAPAQAASCYGDYCSGLNPQDTPCAADAYTVASTHFAATGGTLELRWSPSCKTNWARFSSVWTDSNPNGLSATQRPTNYTQRGVVQRTDSYSWTRMIYSPTKCVFAGWNGGGPSTLATACV